MTSSFTTIGSSGTTVNPLPFDTMSSNSQSSSTTGTNAASGTSGAGNASGTNGTNGAGGTGGTNANINVASSLSTTSAADLQTTFLTLLVTQLKNQDPTSPVDSSQMTSQLAQINTVSGIAQLNTALTSLSSQLTAGQQTQAAMLIGSNVLAPGNTVPVKSGAASPFGVQLTSAVSNLTITVKNASGVVVNTINAGAQSAGTVPFNWTPTDTAGNALPDGTYTISASYTDTSGKQYAPTTLSSAQVLSVVKQADGTPGLVLSNGSTVGFSQVASIFPNTKSASNGSSSSSTN
ncbi:MULTISPECIES: flagellar hook assembly protein FlgD [Burkholderia]|uniref:flagellar hook assembly protein FlgD n=1 Tax=Burkholderia TaxID=32008 RepID=UPI000752A968|nr:MULTISPECIES: flagellar hook assembly protein FlgD [Burkholderia]AOJ70313.1 flagellar biosynthesis protein FlgD [Burkholderia savannae]AOJ82273.1 flagellar biosynthesis protein FlgD [Burkholderia savannae]AOK48418.1 flagellar biosynthesis protein FlgD [Burkholderia sp. MSMB617WGS]KVG38760.1 flagellar biosynthesis protein FlgD [Burkholderia sp. MSMB0265]KVG82079.1 flagellar biosynthesis protein FlgD [Burkholderia sp. MSMB2040]